MRQGLSRTLILLVPCGVVWLLPYGKPFVPLTFAPVYLGAVEWPSAYGFIAGLLGLLFIALVRLGLARDRAVSRAVLYGVSVGLVLFSVAEMKRFTPVSLNWVRGQEHDLVVLDRNARAAAALYGLPVLYYFRADWCPTCPAFERNVLGRVGTEARPFLAVKMDVTDFDRWHTYIKKEYGVEATPTVILRDRTGRVLEGTNFTGEHVSLKALRAALLALGRAN